MQPTRAFSLLICCMSNSHGCLVLARSALANLKRGRTCCSVPTRTMRGLPAAASSPSTVARPGEVEFGVGGADVGFGEAQFAADDVGAFDEGHAFVISDAAAEAFAA